MPKNIDLSTTPAMKAAARRGLELRKRAGGKGGLSTQQAAAQGVGSGVQRASNIIRGRLSPESWKRMHAFFSRHEKNIGLDPGKAPHQDKGYIAGQLWGGSAGAARARKVARQLATRKKDG